jgi:squalene-hopene/tetraprenyl-beta-curcumene cyclase
MQRTDSHSTLNRPATDRVRDAIDRSIHHVFSQQYADGYWWAELESNVTITSEVVLLHRVWGTLHTIPQAKVLTYLRRHQRAHGGWELFYDDGGELSTTVEAYMAMRILGVDASDPALSRARAFIVARGGISKTRIFTKMHLALCGAYDWRGLPTLPPALMLLPDRGPFSIYDMSSWARGSTVPLVIVFDRKPVYGPPLALDELYTEGRANARYELPRGRDALEDAFVALDGILGRFEDWGFVPFRRAGLERAHRWTVERQEATGDWGGIIPAMLNAMLALRTWGYDVADPAVVRGFAALERFAVETDDEYRIQPCVSPVWDTGLVIRALVDAGVSGEDPRLIRAARWLLDKQILDRGDWAVKNRRGAPGGWAFEFDNRFYPDVDDTAVIVMALEVVDLPEGERKRAAMMRAVEWVTSMQCRAGGWAAFDMDNDKAWLNKVPYGDLRAMIDPNTSDVTARVLEMYRRCGLELDPAAYERALRYLLAEQEYDGAWFGRWGVNYVYGTGEVLAALALLVPNAAIDDAIARGAQWLCSAQNADGGWGETCASYEDPSLRGQGPSTASQTAWGLIGLLAAAERDPQWWDRNDAIARGVAYLLETQRGDGTWDESHFTGTGFPGHFYLKYHLYQQHFPLTALGRYSRALHARS